MKMMARICNKILRGTKLSTWRSFQSNIQDKIIHREYKEVEIKVPWGKISGKHWGATDTEPIVAVHGWQDNAASFDPLVKYLPENIPVLAIDLPGHGHSSWIPEGSMYNSLLYLQTIERIRDHYGMEKIALICHSMGGMITFNYASKFPENVKFIVAFDYFKYPAHNEVKRRILFRKEWAEFFALDKKLAAGPRYDEISLIQKSIEATRNSLNESTCRILLSRGTIKHTDGTVSFTRDPRIKYLSIDNGFSHEDLKTSASYINFPYRILKGGNCHFNEPQELYYDVLKVIETHSNDFEFHIVPGTHHFHMDTPQYVANIINPFIMKYL